MRQRQETGNPKIRRWVYFLLRCRLLSRGVDLISDALPFGRLWYSGPNAVSNAMSARRWRKNHDSL
jgi:hypothetical protein